LAVAAASFVAVLLVTVGAGKLLALVQRPDGSTGFDSSITNWVVGHRTDTLTNVAKFLSAIGSQKVLTPLVLVVAVALLLGRRSRLCVSLLVIWGAAIGLYSLAKHFVGRPRPPMDIWLTHAGASSFPSGHAVQSLSTFVVLALVAAAFFGRSPRLGIAVAVMLALGVGWSRVYLGVHWTTDVIAGWLAAATWTTAAWLAAWKPLSPASGALRGDSQDPGDRRGHPPVEPAHDRDQGGDEKRSDDDSVEQDSH
jgi:membrane-associated phospholipid phosphatase